MKRGSRKPSPQLRGEPAQRKAVEPRVQAPSDSGEEPERRAGFAALFRGVPKLWLVPIAAFALCALWPWHSFVEYRNVNEQARLYLVKAIVEEGTLHIDTGIAKYGDLQDKAIKDGHFYCDKPVGLSVVAVPAYFVLYHAGRLAGYEWSIQAMRYVLTVLCVTLPSVLLLFLLARYWDRLGAIDWLVGLGLLAYGFGTIALTYSTQFVGHQLAAVLAFSHFFLSRSFEGRVAWWKLLLAGALAGLGAITDYFTVFVHLAIFASYAPRVRPVTALLPFFAGGALAFAPLPLYNWVAFGGPTKMSYGQEAIPAYQKLHGTGFFGVTWPRPDSIAGLFVSPAKGLFWLSPFLLLGIVGIVLAVRDPRRRRDGLVLAIATFVIAWFGLSVVDWRGGWTIGPRHMVSMLPFLCTAVVLAVRTLPRLAAPLAVSAAVAAVVIFVPTMTLPAYDVNFIRPFGSQALFLLREGIVSANPLRALGIPGSLSLAVPAIAGLGAFAYVLAEAVRARGGIRPRDLALPAVAIAALGFVFTRLYPKPAEPIEMYFQARVLKQADQPLRAAQRFEEAVAWSSDVRVQRQVADRAYPEAAEIYMKLGDTASLERLAQSWARIDPDSPRRKQMTGR